MSHTILSAIDAHYRDLHPYTGLSELPENIRNAMMQVKRATFVSPEFAHLSENDCALPISSGQTISQPYIVALMSHLLGCQPYHRILEVGTGSGYQSAVLSRIVSMVYTLEILPELVATASHRLRDNGYTNVEVKCADGYFGWLQHAPYDGVIITAAVESLPIALLEQMRLGARIVAPIGTVNGIQQLVVAEKQPGSGLDIRTILPVSFVPFTRSH